LVSELGGSVGTRMIGANRHAMLGCDAIAIDPIVSTLRPIEIEAVPVRDKSAARERNMKLSKHDDELRAVDARLGG
jgi:hypothetical protein